MAADAADADATREDVVKRHPDLENENEVSPCAGLVGCCCSPFLALPVVVLLAVVVLTSPTAADMSSPSGLTPLRRLNHCITLRALIVDAGLSLDEGASLPPILGKMAVWRWACPGDFPEPAAFVVVAVGVEMGVVASEALAGVSPVGVLPLRFLIDLLNGSTITVSVFRLFFLSLAASLGVGLSRDVLD